jgi:DNA polymerase-3 subunit delta
MAAAAGSSSVPTGAVERRRRHAGPAALKRNADTLAAELASGLRQAYLVSGEEPLLIGEAADAIRARARERGFSERHVHFIDRSTDWDALRASTGNLSLFAARRIIEIRMPGGKPGVSGAKALLALLSSADPDVLLLVLTERLDAQAQNSEWVRAIESRGVWVAVQRVTPERLPEWLRARCLRAGLTADAEALALLAARTEGNLLAADQEITKLALLAGPGPLHPTAIRDAVGDSARFSVFALGAALSQRDPARALRVLEGLRAEGEEPPLVLWAVLQVLRRRAGDRTTARLATRAMRVDRMVKGRLAGDAWDELALFVVELCGKRVLGLPARI